MTKQILPIDVFLEEVTLAVKQHSSVILMAEPGAGKTTRVPVALSRSETNGKWIVLSPRRWAARLTASRIADENGWKLGEEVGYQIRFENRISPRSKIIFMTEGVLLRRLIEDPDLSGVAGVIFDEFHERNLDSDLGLAIMKEIQGSLRPDLKILVMSATLDPRPLERFLEGSKTFSIPGRTFPVEKRYVKTESVTRALDGVLPDEGDVLIFLPGSREIERTVQEIESSFSASDRSRFEVLPLYASLPDEAQKRVFVEGKKQKIICSTNIAETSLTLPKVKVVIDSGLSKVMRMDPKLGTNKLETLKISRASSEQRAGRAGRVSNGICVRMWSLGEQEALRHFETPEIHRVNLGRAILMLSDFGVRDFEAFEWYEKPKASMLSFAIRELESLGFLKDGVKTELGAKALKLPLDPRMASIVLASEAKGLLHFGARFTSVLESLSPMDRIRDEDQWIKRLNSLSFSERKSAEQIYRTTPVPPVSAQELHRYQEILLEADPGRMVVRGQVVGRRKILPEQGKLPECFYLAQALDRGDLQALSFFPIETSLLQKHAEKKRQLFWDEKLEKVRAVKGDFFKDLELGTLTEDSARGEEAEQVLKTVLLDQKEEFLGRREEFKDFLSRFKVYQTECFEENEAPELPWEDLVDTLVSGKTKIGDILAEPIESLCLGLLPRAVQKDFEESLPSRIDVPSGRTIRIDYSGPTPKLSVRLQELFGWLDTPKIARGKIALTIELLSPGYKPIQVTRDLKSFWSSAYFEVRKELKARYPKHAWPEDPLTAKPEAKGRSQKF